jgi:Tfp pilus assembly protein PilV
MFIRRFIVLSQSGDTIIEVLMAIAVISSVMGGAFVMTNRSLQNSRDSQERVNATKLVESQVEQVKNLASTNASQVFGAGVPASFCISGATGLPVASTGAPCLVNTSGNATSNQPSFRLADSRSGNTFTFTATWTSVRGNAQNKVEIKYRVYQ